MLDFFIAFNTGDVDGTVATLNHPHLFMTAGGGFSVAESPGDGPRPDFDRMRRDENWHMSTIDALEASTVTRNKVHFELTFSRWHPRRHPLLDRARALDRDPRGGPLGHPGPLAHAGHLRRAGQVGRARSPWAELDWRTRGATMPTMHDPARPGESLRDALEAEGWTVTEAAAKLGCTRQTLSRVLNTRTRTRWAFRVSSLEVPDEQQAEIAARRQTWPSHPRIELA